MSASPTARTLRQLRSAGYEPAVVEKWVPRTKRRRDMYGWCDVVAIRSDKPGVLGIQATTATNGAARLAKMLANQHLRTWLAAGNRSELWTWKKIAGKWCVRRREVRMADLLSS